MGDKRISNCDAIDAALKLDGNPDEIKSFYEDWSETYNSDTTKAEWIGPGIVARLLQQFLPDTEARLLDAGCGTGLCGPVLRPISTRLIGVDLSSMMLERAKKLDRYDQLVEAELTGYLEQHHKSYDLIVAADTFNYFGALPALLEAAASALKESGRLIFTLEHSEDADATDGYQLNPNGRYSHQEDYVKTCLADQGLDITCLTRATLRKEKDQPVAALVISARKG